MLATWSSLSKLWMAQIFSWTRVADIEEVVMVERVFLNSEDVNVIVPELLEQHGEFVGSDKFA